MTVESSNPKGTVYIVDDDTEVCQSLQCVMESSGLRVKIYPSAEAFLAEGSCVHPSCLVLDLRMPGTSGETLLERLRREHNDIPVIIASAYGNVPVAVQTMKLGAIDFCEKPVHPDVMLRLTRKALELDAAMDARRRQRQTMQQQLDALSERERKLLDLLIQGKSYKEAGAAMCISARTVEYHRANLNAKLGVDRLAELVRFGLHLEEQRDASGPESEAMPPSSVQPRAE